MRQRFVVAIEGCGERLSCADSDNVLCAMEALGRKGIPVGCRGGGCGVCKVRVMQGSYHTHRMSRSCVSEAEEAAGVVLACKLFPDSDLRIEVVGKMARAVCAGVAK
ncbi:2Fe-2S iron-sulfur cluster-binding protein [Thauera sp. SDU_THAU2]|uniref:2Fe-2S iron-sulfur cluster-binding protein n=1 Tax=Thauera sp. SDU_THAU2 TaxID=3136633 RepID=UPI00311E2816